MPSGAINKMWIIALIIAIVVVGIGFFWIARKINPRPPASQAILNAEVLTMDSDSTTAEAIYIERDRIRAVGSNEEIKQQISPRTRVFDFQGKTVVPGLIEPHGHFPFSGISVLTVDLKSPPIGPVISIAQALELLKEKASNTPVGKWVVGFGYDDTLLSEKRHFTCHDLDRVSTQHPVYVVHVSAHMGVSNSAALQKMGITRETANPEGGLIHKDFKSGEPSGLLQEKANMPVMNAAMKRSLLDNVKVLRAASRDYISKGITTAQNGQAFLKQIRFFTLASRLGLTPLRLILWPNGLEWLKNTKQKKPIKLESRGKYVFGARKLGIDGSIQGYTGYLSKPYHIPPKDGEVEYRGYTTMEKENFESLVKAVHTAGLQMAVHANGDAAIDLVINAYEKAQQAHHRDDARPIIVHAQMMRADQIDRVKKLGMTPSFFPPHLFFWGDRHHDIFLGPDRAHQMNPTNSALKAGIRFSIHLDTPVLPMIPMRLLWTAVNRTTNSGRVLGQEERISAEQALRAVTIDAAWQVFQEDNRGSIEPGKYADLTVLTEDPLKDPERLHEIQVEKTMIGGNVVFEAS